jgi:hypothetical protein
MEKLNNEYIDRWRLSVPTISSLTVMKKQTGIWIDHMEAIVVSLEGDQVNVQHIESGADRHFKPSGGWKAGGTSVAQTVSNEHAEEERRKHQYHAFYKKVMALISDSSDLAIFGPGEAKTELENEIEKEGDLQKKIRIVEPSDRLTENQIVAKVKAFFPGAQK